MIRHASRPHVERLLEEVSVQLTGSKGVAQQNHGEMGSGWASMPPGYGPMRPPGCDAKDSTADRTNPPGITNRAETKVKEDTEHLLDDFGAHARPRAPADEAPADEAPPLVFRSDGGDCGLEAISADRRVHAFVASWGGDTSLVHELAVLVQAGLARQSG